MYNLSLSGIELGLIIGLLHFSVSEMKPEFAEPYADLLKVIESQTTPKAMGGET